MRWPWLKTYIKVAKNLHKVCLATSREAWPIYLPKPQRLNPGDI